MDGERGPPRVPATDVLSSEPKSHPVTRRPVPPSAVAGSAVDGSPPEHVIEERVRRGTAQPDLGTSEDVREETERLLRQRASSGSRELPECHNTGPCKGTSLGRRRRPVSLYRSHPLLPHLAPKRGSSGSLRRQLSGLAALLFLLTFYVRTCLSKRGRFSGLPPGISSSHYRSQNRENDKPPYSDAATPIRRLAGEGFSCQPPDIEGCERGTTTAEEALCGAIEASVAGSRAAASQTVQEESDEDTRLCPSTPTASMQPERPDNRHTGSQNFWRVLSGPSPSLLLGIGAPPVR